MKMHDMNQTTRERFDKLLDDAASAIYVCDAETFELLYINRKCADMVGKPLEAARGCTCYGYLKGQKAPCAECYIHTANHDAYTEREYSSEATGRHYHLRGKLIDWEGRPALVEYMLDETERIAAQRSLRDLVNGLPGGVGIFDAYADGRVELVYLNDGYYAMLNDRREDREAYEAVSVYSAVHPDDVSGLKEEVRDAIREDRMVNYDARIREGGGGYRWMNIRGNIALRAKDKCRFFAFYSDIDALKTTQLKLETSQRGIDVASARSGIRLWLFNLDKCTVAQSLSRTHAQGAPMEIADMPQAIMGTGEVFPDDETAFCDFYQRMLDGADSSECTVRVRSNTAARYEWQHLVYSRLYDTAYQDRMAIGFAINVDLQQDMQLRFEHELQLRHELIKNAINYYQINLTTHVIEEYHSMYDDVPGMCAGATVSETLRAALLHNIAPEDKERVSDTLLSGQLLERYSRGETSVTLVYRRTLPGLGLRWVRSVATIMQRPNSGDVIAFLYTRDIDSERKDRLALQSAMANEIDSVALINVKTGSAHMLKEMDEYSGMQAGASFDHNVGIKRLTEENVLEEDRRGCLDFFSMDGLTSRLAAAPLAEHTFRLRLSDGRILRKRSCAYYLDDTHEDIVISRRDITSLYEEGQRQKKALQSAVDAANEANRAKSDFFSHMSHDMRTPLNAILSMSDVEMTEDATEAQKDDYLEKIHVSGEYLLGIINDVLDMSRIENKKLVLQPEPYYLDDFSNTIQTVIGEQCRQKGIEFTFSVPKVKHWVKIDKVRFNQIFINLLSNAVKFTPAGGKVTFISENMDVENNRIHKRYTVSDTGCGMSKEFLPKAFDSFAQEARYAGAASNQGTGLGLSIVKQLVELMGGSITVESKKGEGTTFIIEMTAELAEPPARAAGEPVNLSVLNGLRILLCEDHPLNAQIDERLLGKKGCIVECAENGRIGCDRFAASPENYYDLVLMDIRMPEMDGLEATRTIRAMARADAKTIPIVAMTADAFIEDVQTSLDAGMNGHLSEPIVPQQLFETIARQIKARG